MKKKVKYNLGKSTEPKAFPKTLKRVGKGPRTLEEFNAVKRAEENWLIDKLERFIKNCEMAAKQENSFTCKALLISALADLKGATGL